MHLLDVTLPTVAENLALDEVLLDEADASDHPAEILRLWESPEVAVVLGRSSRAADEVQLDHCRRQAVPIYRRASGGATVVIGPGCLMYTVVLSAQLRPGVTMIDAAHRVVLGQLVRGLAPLVPAVAHQGISDLTLGDHKVSGNALRIKRQTVLYHGTLLYDFPLDLVGNLLGVAPRQPDYRGGRDHRAFLTCLPLTAQQLRSALIEAWQAHTPCPTWPADKVAALATGRYSQDAWIFAR